MFINPIVIQLLLILLKVVCLLVVIAYYTIAERKIMASIQRRRGPNVVGFWGLLQPVADGLKLVAKEIVIPSHSNSRIFVLAPMVILTLGLVSWSILPFGCFDYSEVATRHEILTVFYSEVAARNEILTVLSNFEPKFANSGDFFKKGPLLIMQTTSLCYVVLHTPRVYPTARFEKNSTIPQENEVFNLLLETNHISDIRYSLLIILAISSLSVYALIIAGWSSNSKYAFLGALRSAAQIISYEVSISLVILPVIFLAGSLNFTEIVISQRLTILYVFPLLPLTIIFFIASLAETNRTPFDLPEAEAELVAGYNIEYSSIIFAMFFLGEYGNITLISVINSDIFFGGWAGSLFDSLSAFVVSVKAVIIAASFVLVRATFPRYRYDQLINIGWKIFLPVATGLMVSAVGVVITFAALPVVHELFIY